MSGALERAWLENTETCRVMLLTPRFQPVSVEDQCQLIDQSLFVRVDPKQRFELGSRLARGVDRFEQTELAHGQEPTLPRMIP